MRKSNGTSKVMLVAVIMAAALFAGGCGHKGEGTKAPAGVETKDAGKGSEKDSEKDSEASKKAGGKETKSTAKSYETELEKKFGKRPSFQSAAVLVKALSENDMDTILGTQKLPENSVVTTDDVSYVLARSELSPFIGLDGTEIVSFEETSGEATARITKESDTTVINLNLNDDNDWVPDLGDLYVKDMRLIAAGKTQITFNGCAVDEGKFAESNTSSKDGSVIYTLTVPNKPFKVVTTSSVFGTLETEITPDTSKKDLYNARPVLSTDSLVEAQDAFRDIFTAMLADASAGVTDVSEYQKYFSDKVDTTLMATSVRGVQGMVKSDGKVVCSEVISRSGSVPGYVITNNRCALNIGYKLSFTYQGVPSDQKRVTWIMLEKKDDGSYGIFKVGDEGIFSTLNKYIQQY